MTYSEIRELCKRGKVGLIPGWIGYLKYNYALDELQFANNDYRMSQSEVEDKIKNRTDLYYII